MKANSSTWMTRAGVKVFCITMLAAGGLGIATAQAQTRAFEAVDIGVVTALGGLSTDFPVRAVGQHVSNGVLTAFEFSESSGFKRNLPVAAGDAAGSTTNALDVSPNGGEAVGTSRGFATDWPNPGGISNPGHYPLPPGCFTGGDAVAINNNRVAVGFCGVLEPVGSKPIRWSVTNQFNVATLPAAVIPGTNVPQSARALDVNDNGIIVGQQGTQPAIWMNPAQLPVVLNLTNGEARGISNGSTLSGNPDLLTVSATYPINYSTTRGFTFYVVNGGIGFISYTRLPFTCFAGPYACTDPIQFLFQTFNGADTHKINRLGFSVGNLKPRNGGPTAAAIWTQTGFVATLAANTSGLPTGTVLTDAVDVNDQNFVLALGTVNGQLHGFLLRPTGVAIGFQQGY